MNCTEEKYKNNVIYIKLRYIDMKIMAHRHENYGTPKDTQERHKNNLKDNPLSTSSVDRGGSDEPGLK